MDNLMGTNYILLILLLSWKFEENWFCGIDNN
jgi:hypothetical protein